MDSSVERLHRQQQASTRVGVVLTSRFDGPVQILQVKFSDLEVRDGVINPTANGISSRPLPGGQVVVSVPGGHAPGGIVVASGDQRYTFVLSEGECALHDDLGQSIHLTRAGVHINGGGLPIQIDNTPMVTANTALYRVQGDIIDNYETNPLNLAQTRARYNEHEHPVPGVQSGSATVTTSIPIQQED